MKKPRNGKGDDLRPEYDLRRLFKGGVRGKYAKRYHVGTNQVEATAHNVSVSDDVLAVDLIDGRTITVPLAWFPRLAHGTPAKRANWRLIGDGKGIHWPDLDEDISVAGLLAGRRSGEIQESLRRWLRGRRALR